MNKFVIIHLTFILLQLQILVTHSLEDSFFESYEKQLNQKSKLNHFTTYVVCSNNSVKANVIFREPFFGIIYAKGFSLECRAYGNGSKVVHFETSSHECGVRSIQNQSNNNDYELVLYVQNDRNIEQSSDEKIEVKCEPQELLLTGVVGNQRNQHSSKFNGKSLFGNSHIQVHQMRSHNFTLSHISDSLECRMDVMKGRMPFLKPIDGFVDLGQDVTIIIKIKEIAGIDSMLSRCYAHDGSHTIKQELTNSDGCAIDTNILPNFEVMTNSVSESKLYYTTFPAFKFPDRTNLNIQCSLIICNRTCPQIHCDNNIVSSPQLHRIKRLSNSRSGNASIITKKKLISSNNNDSNSYDLVLSEIGVSNFLGVKNSESIKNENRNYTHNSFENTVTKELVSSLTSQLVLIFGLLLSVSLLASIILVCYCGIKVRRLKQKLNIIKQYNGSHQPFYNCLQRQDIQNFSYGRMIDLSK